MNTKSPYRHLVPLCLFVGLLTTGLFRPSTSSASEKLGGAVLISMTRCCSDAAWPEAEDALVSELTLDNISVVKYDSNIINPQERLEEMRSVSERHNAAATIRISRSAEQSVVIIDLWLFDAVSGSVNFRRLEMDMATISSPLDVAVRAVEVLRATVVESQIAPPQQEVEPATPVTVTGAYPRFGAGVDGAVLISPRGGTGLRGGFGGSFFVEPIRNLDLELGFLASPIGNDLETETAASTFDFLVLRAGMFYRFSNKSIVTPAIGIGGGSLIAWGQGKTNPGGLTLDEARENVGYLGGGARLDIKITGSLHAVLGAFVAAAIPEVVIRHGDDEAGRFGRPVVDGTVGLQVRMP